MKRQQAAIQRISRLGDDDRLLTPREVAEMFGVRTTTIARWAREGRLASVSTPGRHRRYRLGDVRAVLDDPEPSGEGRRWAEDAARLYDQGWSIAQVAEKFDVSYGTMRRLLQRDGVRFRGSGRGGRRS